MVFTAYLSEEFIAKNNDGANSNQVTSNWYPTIFFYDLFQNKVVWEIFGAEQFISIDKSNNILVLTNEIWTEKDYEDYQRRKDENPDDFCRHWDFDSYIWKLKYHTDAIESELGNRENKAPIVPTLNSYKLTFGNNKDLEITNDVKIVEAYTHN